jgi:capsule synthesis protein PGA_cap
MNFAGGERRLQQRGHDRPGKRTAQRACRSAILSDAHRPRLDGAKVVIVNLHCGDQNVARPSSFQLTLAATLTRTPDITAIVGQHVHIVQAIRILNGKLVVFGRRGTCGTTQAPRTANRW